MDGWMTWMDGWHGWMDDMDGWMTRVDGWCNCICEMRWTRGNHGWAVRLPWIDVCMMDECLWMDWWQATRRMKLVLRWLWSRRRRRRRRRRRCTWLRNSTIHAAYVRKRAGLALYKIQRLFGVYSLGNWNLLLVKNLPCVCAIVSYFFYRYFSVLTSFTSLLLPYFLCPCLLHIFTT